MPMCDNRGGMRNENVVKCNWLKIFNISERLWVPVWTTEGSEITSVKCSIRVLFSSQSTHELLFGSDLSALLANLAGGEMTGIANDVTVRVHKKLNWKSILALID